jgi:hypothetical protein
MSLLYQLVVKLPQLVPLFPVEAEHHHTTMGATGMRTPRLR